MDNLAHTLVSSIVGTAIKPEIAKRQPVRFFLTQAIITNLPDTDIILAFFDKNTYHFHHRGFTHSIFGMLIIFPLCYIINHFLLAKHTPTDLEEKTMPYGALILIQLVFSHFFLDWLTSYGVMFFYPFSYARMSYPLMFIIDPMLWMIGTFFVGSIIFGIRKNFCFKSLRKFALLGISCIGILWSIELTSKLHTISFYTSKAPILENRPREKLKTISYPTPFAPYVWSILELDTQDPFWYRQTLATPLGKEHMMTAPEGRSSKDNCSQDLTQYKNWGEYNDCEKAVLDGKQGCLCVSLKYSFPHTEFITFGAYFWVDGEPHGHFIVPPKKNELWHKSLKLYKTFIRPE